MSSAITYDVDTVADIILNYHNCITVVPQPTDKGTIIDIACQVKKLLIELEADVGGWLSPAYFIKVLLNEDGESFIFKVAESIFNIVSEYISTCEYTEQQPLFI